MKTTFNEFIRRGKKLTPDLLLAKVEEYRATVVPQLDVYYDYYHGETKIKHRELKNPNNPNNKTPFFLGELIVKI